MNERKVYAVILTEMDGYRTFAKETSNFELIGLFGNVEKAVAEINKFVLGRKELIKAHYEKIKKDIAEEIKADIACLQEEDDPQVVETIHQAIDSLKNLEERYKGPFIPEILVEEDVNGEIFSVTAKDDDLEWLCAFDIKIMTVQE